MDANQKRLQGQLVLFGLLAVLVFALLTAAGEGWFGAAGRWIASFDPSVFKLWILAIGFAVAAIMGAVRHYRK